MNDQDQPQATSPYGNMCDHLERISHHLEHQLSSHLIPKLPKTKIFTINSAPYEVDTLGFRYVGLYVAATHVITINTLNITYTITLQPGINRLNVITGSQISSSDTFACIFYWTDVLFDSDTISSNGSGGASLANAVDIPDGDSGAFTATAGYQFNGTTFERRRGNVQTIIYDAALHPISAETITPTQINHNGKGLALSIYLGQPFAASTFTIDILDIPPVTFPGTPYGVIASKTTSPGNAGGGGSYFIYLYPGASQTFTDTEHYDVFSMPLPRNFALRFTPSTSDPWSIRCAYTIIM